ncbi:MAG: hypothetical protein H7Z72_02860 [Bacteroidetes bacterium]|nr:hypothetical protein [Fibrella sp.]
MKLVNSFVNLPLSAALTLFAVVTIACTHNGTSPLPDTIAIHRPALYPESMAYDAASQCFIVGSLTTGTLGQVRADGTYFTLYR